MRFIELRHPKTGATWPCPAGAVEAWLAKGWERAKGSLDEETTESASAVPVQVVAAPAAPNTRKDK